jgi:hypothetical protein
MKSGANPAPHSRGKRFDPCMIKTKMVGLRDMCIKLVSYKNDGPMLYLFPLHCLL